MNEIDEKGKRLLLLFFISITVSTIVIYLRYVIFNDYLII